MESEGKPGWQKSVDDDTDMADGFYSATEGDDKLAHSYNSRSSGGTLFFLGLPLALLSAVIVLLPWAVVSKTDMLWYKVVPRNKYAVIFDAGSSGSRMHIYCFDTNNELVKVGDELEIFMHTEPGLSDFAKEPRNGAESLRPMLEEALRVVPADQHATTPLRLGATAGLRLLPGDEAKNLLQEVRTLLSNSGFLFKPEWVNIIDGTQEGSYQWVTTNYLRGSLGKTLDETVAIVDLGGGSVQMAYAISDEDYSKAPKAGHDELMSVQQVKLLNMSYNLYVHSYLHYGLLAFRAEVFKHSAIAPCPCVAKDFEGSYLYSGVNHTTRVRNEGSHFQDCRSLVIKILNVDHACKHLKCTFGGVWNGGGGDGFKQLFVASFFFDKAVDAGIIRNKKAASVIVTPAEFERAAKTFCSLSLAEIVQQFPKLKEIKRKYICLDLVYLYSLLVSGFGIDQNQEITLVKKIVNRGLQVEASWPLGSAIELVSGYQ